MKIAMFTDAYWPRINGVTISVDSFSRALARLGHEVLIVCPEYPESFAVKTLSESRAAPPPGDCGERLKVLRVPSKPTFLSKEDVVVKTSKSFWVTRRLDEFLPDIIHINAELIAEFAFNYAWKRELPVVYTFHTIWEDYVSNYIPRLPLFIANPVMRFWRKLIFIRTSAIIAPSVQIHDLIKEYNIKRRIYILPTGIDAEMFQKTPEEVERFRNKVTDIYPKLRNKRILLFAGRIANEKNIQFLIDIAPAVIQKHPESAFLLVGDGVDAPEFQKRVDALNMTDYFTFTGFVSREDVSLFYALSSVFVLPSLTETQGLVTIEAMMSGLPVVAIGANGTLMVMNGDNGGFMVKNDAEEFTRRVFDLLEDAALYRQKSAEARTYSQNWTIDNMAAKLVAIYQNTIGMFNYRRTFWRRLRLKIRRCAKLAFPTGSAG